MICTRCNRQMADNSTACPNCGQPVIAPEQILKEVKFRRFQRYLFYVVGVLIVGAAVGIIVRVYNNNTKLVLEISEINQALENAQIELEETEETLDKIRAELEASSQRMQAADNQLQQRTSEYQALLSEKSELESSTQQCQMDLNLADANIYGLIVRLGVGVTSKNLSSIPLADANLEGLDSDGDGLSDNIERSLGTDPFNPDTDGDGYDDKSELLSGHNPLGSGMLPINPEYVNSVKGKILINIEGDKSAWYIASDGKRYYLGHPGDAYGVMRQNEYWTKDWSPSDY